MKAYFNILILFIIATNLAFAFDLDQKIEAFKVPKIHGIFSQGEKLILNGQELVVGEQLGKGAHGVVYRTSYSGKNIAAKVATPDHKKDLIKEAIILEHLKRTAGILESQGIFEDSIGNTVLLMEEARPVSGLDFNKDFAIKLVKTLSEIHKKGIGHNDLKIDNVLVDKNKNPIVIDFGRAYQIKNSPSVLKKDLGDLWTILLVLKAKAGGMHLILEYAQFFNRNKDQITEKIIEEYKKLSDEDLKGLWERGEFPIDPDTGLKNEEILRFLAEKLDLDKYAEEAFLANMSVRMDALDKVLFDLMIGKVKTTKQALERLTIL